MGIAQTGLGGDGCGESGQGPSQAWGMAPLCGSEEGNRWYKVYPNNIVEHQHISMTIYKLYITD